MKRANLQISLQYRFADRPLALAPRAVDAVMSAPRAMFGGDIAPAQRDQGWGLTDGGIAVLPVFGTLLQRADEFTRWLGIASYDDIADTTGAIFRSCAKGGTSPSRNRLSVEAVAITIKKRVKEIGLDPTQYSGHSLRAGYVTSAIQAGAAEHTIRRQTGHASSATMERYIRIAELFEDNATSLLF